MGSLLDKLDKFEKKEPKEAKPKEIQKSPPEVKPKKTFLDKAKESKEKNEFDKMSITQDDLWFLYRLKMGKSTRLSKSKLLPKFFEVLKREIQK